MVILDPKLTDADLEKTLGEIKGHIKENAFTIIDEDNWGKRDFAYKIKGNVSGYYIVMNFEGEGVGTAELHKELRLQTGLMRYLLIKVPEDYQITRFTQERSAKPSVRKLQSKHAEELSKKVTSKKASVVKEKAEEKEESKDTKKLDEQLKAIIDDTDIDL